MLQEQPNALVKLTSIGEEIGYELGSQMVRDYQVANPNDIHFYVIGREIIDQILAQPGCVGIKFFNAYNEIGEKTMVYLGLNEEGKCILKFTSVNNEGQLLVEKGIVADRIDRGGGGITRSNDSDDWNWEVD